MEPDPQFGSARDQAEAGASPPVTPAMQPPIIGSPPLAACPAPPVPLPRSHKAPRQLLTILLSLCLGLFLADGIVSLTDDTAILWLDFHGLTALRVIVFLLATLLGLIVYLLMGLTPMIPKRLFLPVTLFNGVAQLVVIPFYIYDYQHIPMTNWGISLLEVICALLILYRVQGGWRIRWPLVAEDQLRPRGFSWLNLVFFVGTNIFVLLPALMIYVWVCAGRAVDHFSDSFMALRPNGFSVQVRTYVRDDGKSIQLVPMSHIGELGFYRQLSQSFSTNALILMEGVTDNRDLLTNKITYRRVAKSLGLAEQQREFKPRRERVVRADVDVEQFTPSTIGLLNEAMLIHSRGLNAETLPQLLQYSPPPGFEEYLVEDLLRKRNRHLLQEIQTRLAQSDELIVPWGVAHMPELAREIQKLGFHLRQRQEYVAISFGMGGKRTENAVHDDISAGSK